MKTIKEKIKWNTSLRGMDPQLFSEMNNLNKIFTLATVYVKIFLGLNIFILTHFYLFYERD